MVEKEKTSTLKSKTEQKIKEVAELIADIPFSTPKRSLGGEYNMERYYY